jgi:hypothetical protein
MLAAMLVIVSFVVPPPAAIRFGVDSRDRAGTGEW